MESNASIQKINELSNELLATRKQINEIESTTDILKTKRDELQKQLLVILTENKLKQWKTEDATISRKESFRYVVLDRKALVEGLKNSGLGQLVSELPNEYWRMASVELAKQGQVLAGAKIEAKEYISVSLTKPKIEEPIKKGWALDAGGDVIHD